MGDKANETNRAKYALWTKYKPQMTECPFCGSKNTGIEKAVYCEEDSYVAKCKNCYATTKRTRSPEEAIRLWKNGEFPCEIWLTNKGVPYTDDPDIWGDLKNAIVLSVLDEYKKHKRGAIRNWRIKRVYDDHMYRANNERKFFYTNDYRRLADIDPEKILEAADKQCQYDVLFREKHGCRGCGTDECEHQRYIWWLWDKGNDHDKCLGWKKRKGKKGGRQWS